MQFQVYWIALLAFCQPKSKKEYTMFLQLGNSLSHHLLLTFHENCHLIEMEHAFFSPIHNVSHLVAFLAVFFKGFPHNFMNVVTSFDAFYALLTG